MRASILPKHLFQAEHASWLSENAGQHLNSKKPAWEAPRSRLGLHSAEAMRIGNEGAKWDNPCALNYKNSNELRMPASVNAPTDTEQPSEPSMWHGPLRAHPTVLAHGAHGSHCDGVQAAELSLRL